MEELNKFKADINNFGILKWKIDEPSLQVDYLDLTLQIVDGHIQTKTYQKPINLYQYITPSSAHPPWMIQGIITSMIKGYYHQNTNLDDFWEVSMKFYRNMKARGWDRKLLEPMFITAYNKAKAQPEHQSNANLEEVKPKERMILHLEYHPNDIPRKLIRRTWDKYCREYLSKPISDGGLGIKETIIAYSRPRNLKDVLQNAKLQQLPGKEVSTYL